VISLIPIKVIHLLGGQALPLLEPIIWAVSHEGANVESDEDDVAFFDTLHIEADKLKAMDLSTIKTPSSLTACSHFLLCRCALTIWNRALEWGKQLSLYLAMRPRKAGSANLLILYMARHIMKLISLIKDFVSSLRRQMSRHPMIVACHCEGRSIILGKLKYQKKILRTLDPVGVLTLKFDDGETYEWSKVTTSIYNITLGKLYCDHYGTMRIKGGGNYSCRLKFKKQSVKDRNPRQVVHGFVLDNRTGEKVAILIGKWDEAMYYVLGDPTTKPKGYDPMTEAITLGMMDKFPSTDSRLRPDQRHLENGEYHAAKLRLEQLRKDGNRDGLEKMKGIIGGYWEAREKKIGNKITDIFKSSNSATLFHLHNHLMFSFILIQTYWRSSPTRDSTNFSRMVYLTLIMNLGRSKDGSL
ncbi:LOW QUALITY PROTEIN: hypothetical protein HID58_021355, partial [Brassica napus]